MRAKLLSKWGAEPDAEFWIEAEATIGRGADNSVRLDAKPVSGRHARIFFDMDAGAYFLEDLGSLNGTELDGTPVTRIEKLGRLHVLRFAGVYDLLFVEVNREVERAVASEPEAPLPSDAEARAEGTRVDAEVPELPATLRAGSGEAGGATLIEEVAAQIPEKLTPAETPESPPADDDAGEQEAGATEPVPEEASVYVLAVVEEGARRRFHLAPGDNLIGRSKGAQVTLRSPQLSRRHAILKIEGERVTVRDLGSRNRTYVDDVEVEGEVEIEPLSRLRFGLLEAHLLRHDDDDPTVPHDMT